MAKKQLTPEAENRRNALEYVGAGGALVGASIGADAAVAADRHRRKMDGPIKAATKGKLTRRHLGQVGVKAGGRAAFAAGAPLAAYGAYRLAKPKEMTPRMSVKRDVAAPLAQGMALKDLHDAQAKRVGMAKSALPVKEQKELVQRKKKGRHLSLVGAGLGVTALGLRAPEAAKGLMKLPKVGSKIGTLKPVKSIAAKEPAATKASNAVGTVALGTGAISSLNYAAQQKLEAKQVAKSLGAGHIKGIGRVRVVNQHSKDLFRVLDNKDQYRLVPRGRLTWVKDAKPKAAAKPKPVQDELPFEKADRDRFLRQYGDRISPKAEEGYNHLKAGRNKRRRDAALGIGTGAVLTTAGTAGALANAPRFRSVGGKIGIASGLGLAGLGALATSGGVDQARSARRWNGHLKKIKSKAKQRAAAGEFGQGRLVEKADYRAEAREKARRELRRDAVSDIAASTPVRDHNKLANDLLDQRIRAKEDQLIRSKTAKARAAKIAGKVIKSAGQKAEGAAQVAAGGTALGLGLSSNRLVNAAERSGTARVERWRSSRVAALGDPVVRTQPGAPRAAKERAKAKTKATQGAINEVNRKANKTTGVLRRAAGGKTRGALITAGFATAVPNIWLGSRKAVEKADKHDVDAFMGGALGTAGAYHGALYATKGVDRRIERNLATDPEMKATLNEHRRAVGLPKDARKGDSRWLKYHREYPKSIPGWKWKRTLSRLQGGKSQIALTGAAAAAGGLGAVAANRKIHPKSERVGKAFGLKIPGGVLKPKMPGVKPRIRQSYVGTSPTGSKFTVRGSVR